MSTLKTKRSLYVALLVLALVLLTALSAQAAGDEITDLTYTSFQDVSIRAAPNSSARVLGTAHEGVEYTVVSYAWTPDTSMNSWARIQYRSGRTGYVPVQIGYTIYGQVVFNLGILWGQ